VNGFNLNATKIFEASMNDKQKDRFVSRLVNENAKEKGQVVG
jgi:hypothetical protein